MHNYRFQHTNPECMIVIAIIAIIAAIAIPQLHTSARIINDPVIAVKTVERIAEQVPSMKLPTTQPSDEWTPVDMGTTGIDTDEFEVECGVAGAPYALEVKGKQWRISCPHEENHLGFGSFKPMRTLDGWTLPSGPDESRVQTWALVSRVIAEPLADGSVAIYTKSYWLRPLALLVVSIGVLVILVRLGKNSKRLKELGESLSGILGMCILMSIVWLVYLSFGWHVTVLPNGSFRRARWAFGITISEYDEPRDNVVAVVKGKGVDLIARDEDELYSVKLMIGSEENMETLAGMIGRRMARPKPSNTEKQSPAASPQTPK
jgi:competence protein ComGC